MVESSFCVTKKAWHCRRKLVSVSSSSVGESLVVLIRVLRIVGKSLNRLARFSYGSSFDKSLNRSSSVAVSSLSNSGILSRNSEVCVESLGAVVESSFYVTEKAWQCWRKLVSVSSSSARESLAVSVRVLQIVGKLLNRLARFSCGSSFGKSLNRSSFAAVSSSSNSGISSRNSEVCVESLGAVVESFFCVTKKAWQCRRKLVSVSSSLAGESLAVSVRVLRITQLVIITYNF